MTFDRNFYLRAASLARSSPDGWSHFLTEMKRVSDLSKDLVLDIDLDKTLPAKGYAMACRDILNALTNCKDIAEKIETKSKP